MAASESSPGGFFQANGGLDVSPGGYFKANATAALAGYVDVSAGVSLAGGALDLSNGGAFIKTGLGHTLLFPNTVNGTLMASVNAVGPVTGTPGAGNFLCGDGTWKAVTGTVSTISTGNLSPLFTASIANPTTTPAISFALTNAAGNSWFGNATGSAAAPAYNTTPIPTTFMPALTGDVTNSSGTVATTVKGINGVILSSLASGLHYNTTATGAPSIATSAQVAAALTGATGTLNLASTTLTLPTTPVNQGGTGVATLSSGGLLIGNGTSAVGAATANQVAAALTGTTGTLNLASATLTLPAIADSGVSGAVVATQSGTTVNWASGLIQERTITSNLTLTGFSNPVSGKAHVLIFKSSGGAFAVTLPTGSNHIATAATTSAITSGDSLIMSAIYDGTNYYWAFGANIIPL